MKNKVCYIVGAGDFYPHGLGTKQMPIHEGDYIIAADGGYDYLKAMSITPSLSLGDFDSISNNELPEHSISFPPEKDDTDFALAVQHGLSLGYNEFHLFGCTGGRIDHTLGNLQILCSLSSLEKKAFLYDKSQVITAITNTSIVLPSRKDGYVSVVSYTDTSEGVTIEGLKYEVFDHTFSSIRPIGISNEFINKKARITVENGTLLIIYSLDSSTTC